MAENQNTSQQADNQASHLEEADWYLQSIVDLVNRTNIEIGISLTVSGCTVTGTLISGKEYFSRLGSMITHGWNGSQENKEQMGKFFSAPSKIYDSEPQRLPGYIHLAGAKLVYASDFIPTDGMLWRGRLSEVSGFTVGLMKKD